MYCSTFDGVLFVEGIPPGARALRKLEVTLQGIGSQLQTLDDVKRRLAADARRLGANAVISFTYGQKASWWAMDHVKWHGAGMAAKLPPDVVKGLSELT
jgi:hypothetical protein